MITSDERFIKEIKIRKGQANATFHKVGFSQET